MKTFQFVENFNPERNLQMNLRTFFVKGKQQYVDKQLKNGKRWV